MEKYDFQMIANVPYSAVVTFPPDVFHQSVFYKITYIESGNVDVEFRSRTNGKNFIKKCTITDAFIITPRDVHRYIVDVNEEDYRHRDIYVFPEVMKICCDLISPDLYDEINSGEYPCFFKVSTNELLSLGEKLSIFINHKVENRLSMIHKSIVVSLLGVYYIYGTEKKLFPDWIQDLLRNLEKRDFLMLPIEKIVKSTNYSHCYVSRVFRQCLGKSLKQYVDDKKLEMSAVMLVNSDSAVDDIASYLGIHSISHYIKAFKKKYGISPGKYRKTLRENRTSIRLVDWGEKK